LHLQNTNSIVSVYGIEGYLLGKWSIGHQKDILKFFLVGIIVSQMGLLIPLAFGDEGLKIEKILPEKSNYIIGEKATLFVTVNNTSNQPITISEITTLHFENIEFQSIDIPQTTTKLIEIKLDTTGKEAGTYNIATELKSEQMFASGFTTITVAEKKSPALNAHFDSILFLLAAFIIPAQIIERVVDQLKKGRWLDEGHEEYLKTVENATTYGAIRTKYAEALGTKWTDGKDTQALDSLNKKIANAQEKKWKHERTYELRILILSIAIAIIPAIPLSYFGFGLFQVTGMVTQDFKMFDVIVNTLFIGVGTKPIHDIIGVLKKVQPKAS